MKNLRCVYGEGVGQCRRVPVSRTHRLGQLSKGAGLTWKRYGLMEEVEEKYGLKETVPTRSWRRIPIKAIGWLL